MIEQVINILQWVGALAVGSCVGSYVASKIMKYELKKEVSGYILNELPHLLESEEFKQKGRELARVFVRELIDTLSEELGLKEKEG